MMDFLSSSAFWIGLAKIIGINIVLSGDNAVVIALAARTLPPSQQRRAILFGSGAAVALRVLLTAVAAWLLTLAWLQIAGGLLLLWIGVQLFSADHAEGAGKSQGSLFSAIRAILAADLVMSLDNVVAVAAAAQGSLTLLILGLAISIPLVVFGSTLMMGLMGRYPFIIAAGAALIGWVAGETFIKDAALASFVGGRDWPHYAAAALGAALVLAAGKIRARRTS